MKAWFGIPLLRRVLGGLALGLLLGLVWPQAAPSVAILGDLFVRAIRMLVAPIVLVTIAAGITQLADPGKLGRIGGRTALLVRPGVGAGVGEAAPQDLGTIATPYAQLVGIVPLIIVDALARGDMLALIFVAILTGCGTVLAGKPFARLLDMTRTVPSASANLGVALTVARIEAALDQDVYRKQRR